MKRRGDERRGAVWVALRLREKLYAEQLVGGSGCVGGVRVGETRPLKPLLESCTFGRGIKSTRGHMGYIFLGFFLLDARSVGHIVSFSI